MKKKLIRAVSMAVVSALCVGAAAYASPTPSYKLDAAGTPVVMTVNGDEVHANEYASYMVSAKMNFEAQMAQFGMEPTTVWNDPTTGAQFTDAVRESTKSMVTQYRVVLQKYKENGLQLNLNEKKELQAFKKSVIDQLGGQEGFEQALASQGLSEAMYDNSLLVSSYAKALNDFYFGPNGTLVPDEQAMTDAYNKDYLQAKHVLIQTQDETGAPLADAEKAKKKALAEEVLKKAQAGEDFDALITQYGEDGGMAANPAGYIFKEGDMVEEFYAGAKALKDGEISPLVESQFGYHIILRVPLDQKKMADYKDALVSAVSGKDFPSMLQEWSEGAKVTLVDEELAKITMDNVLELAMTGTPAAAAQPAEGTAPETDAAAPTETPEAVPATVPAT